MSSFPFTPSIAPGSTIVVTGATGLVATHIINELITAGYRVRGTVRNLKKASWLSSRFPTGLQLTEIPDVSAPNAWATDNLLDSVAGIIHVLGAVDESPSSSPDDTVAAELPWHFDLLRRAKDSPTVKSFVLTSSAWAAYTPQGNKAQTLTTASWNEDALSLARDQTLTPQQKGLAPFMALKTLLEQEFWAWIEREKPGFTFNAVLLDTVIGASLHPKGQHVQSTAGMAQDVYEGNKNAFIGMMQPQWFIDTGDAGRLFVAALVTPGCDRERVFGFAERFSWPKVREIFAQINPDKKGMLDVPDFGWDQTEVPNQRAEELLRGVNRGSGWRTLEDSLRDLYECIV